MSGKQFKLIIFTILAALPILFSGCSDDETYYKVAGKWEGEIVNSTTGQDWAFNIFFEHRGKDISGYYSDYRGEFTLRNLTYDGVDIGFIIDLWPETVTFIGIVNSEASMNGTWSYSEDGNNGSWYLYKDQDPEEEEEEEEETDTESSRNANPFQGV